MSITIAFNARRSAAALALSAGLFGCGPDASSLGETPTLAGRIPTWTQGQGQVWAKVSGTVLATGSVDPGGSFSLTLPGRDVMAPLLTPMSFCPKSGTYTGYNCNLSIEPPEAQAVFVGFSAGNADLLHQNYYQPAPPDVVTIAYYYYYDRDLNVGGTVTGFDPRNSQMQSLTTYDLHVRSGWNIVQMRYSPNKMPSQSEFVTAPLPDDVRWVWPAK